MIRASGQALLACARLLHVLTGLAMGVVVVASLLLAGLAYRLSQGPINARWAFGGDAIVIDGGGASIAFDGAALAWEGFHNGAGFPIDLRLTNIRITDPAGRPTLVAPDGTVSLALAPLLTGRIVPSALEMADGQITLRRDRSGAFNLGTDSTSVQPVAQASLADLLGPSGSLGQLHDIRLRHFGLTLHDDKRDLTLRAPEAALELARSGSGTISGTIRLDMLFGDQRVGLDAGLRLPASGGGRIEATLGWLQPKILAGLDPALAPLRDILTPVSARAAVTLDRDLVPVAAQADIRLDTGQIRIGDVGTALLDGSANLSWTAGQVTVNQSHLTFPPNRAGEATRVALTGTIGQQVDRLTAAITVTADHLEAADLPQLWPSGVGGGARPWILQNLLAGSVSHASISLTAETGMDFTDVVVTKAAGDLDADNVTLTWLDQIPPIDRAQAHLHLMDADRLLITMPSGHQRISQGADLLIQDGQMLITGLSVHDQDTQITLHASGSIASALSLLKEPRLNLLSKHPIDLKDPSGDSTMTISLLFPLENKLQAEQIVFNVGARLDKVRIGQIVAGRDLTDGGFDLTADKDGLTLKGQGALAGIPVTAAGSMDFNAGPPGQVLQRITATGRPTVAQLAAAGVDTGGLLVSGEVPLTAALTERRGGDGSLALSADLASAALRFKPLGWVKPDGVPAKASAVLALSHDRLTAIRQVAADSRDLALAASAECQDGSVRSVAIEHASVGKTELSGSIRLPAKAAMEVVLSGPRIDLSSHLEAEADPVAPPPAEDGPDWALDARFDRVLLAHGQQADAVAVRARHDGGVLRTLRATGSLGPQSAFSAEIGPVAGVRRLTVEAADAGAVLLGGGIARGLRSGTLSIAGTYDDKRAGHPLSGTARIEGGRLVEAPVLGKLLQAMTLYGVADLLSGPGIGLSSATMPFEYQNDRLRITDGRVFSSALGLTVKGLIDLRAQRLALSGTIVPAYMINSLLGHIPLLGKIFSPEVGGGLFAARYSVDGQVGDPAVSVNPLSVLTPGFLRGLFDIGGEGK